MPTLPELLDLVSDEASFLRYVRGLYQERTKNPMAPGWSTETVSDFLEAALAWAEETDFGRTQGLQTASPWKKAAVFVYLGTIHD